MDRVSLTHLRVFCEVADCLSVTQAARQLHRSQPAISRQLADLERELGVTLFSRRNRQLSLTPEGVELHARSRVLLDDVGGLIGRAQELAAGDASVLRVGAISTALEEMIPAVVLAFRRAWPNVGVRMTEANAPDLASLVETGQLDLAFTRDVTSDALSSERLFPMHLVAVLPASHRLAGRESLEIQDLEREPLLLTPPGTGSRLLLARICKAEGLTLRDIRIETNAYRGLMALVEGGYGIAVVLSTIALAHPHARVLPMLHRGEQLGIWFSLVWHRQRKASAHMDAFVETAQKLMKRRYPGREYGFRQLPE